ncbi:MAG: class I adenylate-forming enzyme family protein [Microcella sp.]
MRDHGRHLAGWIDEAVEDNPAVIAVVDRAGQHTYAELGRAVEELTTLLRECEVPTGSRVVTIGRNALAPVVLFLACARRGIVVSPLSWRLTVPELAHALARVSPVMIVVDDEFLPAAQQAADASGVAAPILPSDHRSWPERSTTTCRGPGGSDERSRVHAETPLLLAHTSGTARAPKFVTLTHGNCWWANRVLQEEFPIQPGDAVLGVMPQYHVGGWNVFPLLALHVGATVILPDRFDAGQALELLEKWDVVMVMGVPAHYSLLAGSPAFRDSELSSLRVALVGGAPVSERLRTVWRSRGVTLVEGYGLTEAGPHVLVSDHGSSSGGARQGLRAYPGVEARLIDAHDGSTITGPGVGELLVRSPGVFAGYLGDDVSTRDALCNGWLRTGDRAERDTEGRYRILERLDDLINTGGEGVSPAEVEAVLAAHPAVTDAVVVGVSDERWGQVPVAAVVIGQGRDGDLDALTSHCRERLAPYKVPTRIHVIDAVPRTDLGKVRRAELRRLLDDHGALAPKGSLAR